MSVDVEIPQIGESITTVFIARWIAKPGDAVRAGEGFVEIDSDKASMEIPAPVSGVLEEQLAEEGDEVEIGAIIAKIKEGAQPDSDSGSSSDSDESSSDSDESSSDSDESSSDSDESKAGSSEDAGTNKAASGSKGEVRAGPAARKQAGKQGVDLGSVKGTGPRGRVTSQDVVKFQAPAGSASVSAPQDQGARTERVKMSPLRRTIARRLVEAQHNAAMLTTFNEVDMSAVMDMRKRYQDRFVKKYGHKLGFMSFFVKAVIEGLKAFPALNAEIDAEANEFVYKNYYNIGVAVSGPKGLVVPVLRDADQLSFSGVETGITDLATKARDNKLSLDDFKDGTFTISNGGIFGSMMSTPILNPPQVGILGMHNIVQRPVVIDGEIVIRPMMYVALSYDHRIVDGKGAVSFLVRVKECIEDPERILIEV